MKTNLNSKLSTFMREEKIKMKLRTVSDSEFWLEGPYDFLTAKFHVDEENREIAYDIFSPKYDVHLKESDLRDVEKLDLIVAERGKWNYEKSIEDLWLTLDCIKLWAQTNRFSVKEKRLL
jgi:hypothetical protein